MACFHIVSTLCTVSLKSCVQHVRGSWLTIFPVQQQVQTGCKPSGWMRLCSSFGCLHFFMHRSSVLFIYLLFWLKVDRLREARLWEDARKGCLGQWGGEEKAEGNFVLSIIRAQQWYHKQRKYESKLITSGSIEALQRLNMSMQIYLIASQRRILLPQRTF